MKTAFRSFLRSSGGILVCATILLSATGCGQQAVQTVATQTEIPVQVHTPQTGTLTQSSEFIGTVQPDEIVQVLPKMGGTAIAVHFKVGDVVKQGDILFEVDSTDLELQLAAQRASLEASRAGLATAQAQVDQQLGSGFDIQMAQLQTQVESAKKQYSAARQGLRDYNDGKSDTVEDMADKRNKLRDTLPLLEGQVLATNNAYNEALAEAGPDNADDPSVKAAWAKYELAQQKLKDTESTISLLSANINEADDVDAQGRQLRTAVSNAQLAYDSANTIYELTKGEAHGDALKVANANLKQATAGFEAQAKSYEAASHQLTYTKTIAPIDGVIEACNVTTNAMVGTQNPAFVISNKSDIVVTFYVSADAVRQMALGDKVTIESGRDTFAGTLIEVGSMSDPQYGLFKVKASVENGSGLMTGLSVKIIAETAKANNVLLVPQSAIHYEQGKAYVYVNQDGIAIKTMIETGVANNEVAEVLSGLSKDSNLIVSWNPNLRDGAVITVKSGQSEENSSSQEAQS